MSRKQNDMAKEMESISSSSSNNRCRRCCCRRRSYKCLHDPYLFFDPYVFLLIPLATFSLVSSKWKPMLLKLMGIPEYSLYIYIILILYTYIYICVHYIRNPYAAHLNTLEHSAQPSTNNHPTLGTPLNKGHTHRSCASFQDDRELDERIIINL